MGWLIIQKCEKKVIIIVKSIAYCAVFYMVFGENIVGY
jgi:hypothetical protein